MAGLLTTGKMKQKTERNDKNDVKEANTDPEE